MHKNIYTCDKQKVTAQAQKAYFSTPELFCAWLHWDRECFQGKVRVQLVSLTTRVVTFVYVPWIVILEWDSDVYKSDKERCSLLNSAESVLVKYRKWHVVHEVLCKDVGGHGSNIQHHRPSYHCQSVVMTEKRVHLVHLPILHVLQYRSACETDKLAAFERFSLFKITKYDLPAARNKSKSWF